VRLVNVCRSKQLQFFSATLLSFCVYAATTQAQLIDLTGWQLNTTDARGQSSNSTINALVSQITADVREVWSTADNIYVKSAGVPSYNVGPFNDGNPSYPSDRNWQLRFSRNPQAATGTHTATPLGAIGLWVNGVRPLLCRYISCTHRRFPILANFLESK
jgi:hypothetical protein